jgi:hypothetical protein
MSAISGVASDSGTTRSASSGVETARAKIITRPGAQVSRSRSSVRTNPSGRAVERGL